MNAQQALEFVERLTDMRLIASKAEFIQLQQAIQVLQESIKPVVEKSAKK